MTETRDGRLCLQRRVWKVGAPQIHSIQKMAPMTCPDAYCDSIVFILHPGPSDPLISYSSHFHIRSLYLDILEIFPLQLPGNWILFFPDGGEGGQIPKKPQEKFASDGTTLSFLLLLVTIFIPQLHGNKHRPPFSFCPHPSFLAPSNFPYHPPHASCLGDSLLPPPLYTTTNTPCPLTQPIGCLSPPQLPRIRQADVGAPRGRPRAGEVVLLQPEQSLR
ncbi:hypothetical protein Q8A73_007082 [Channa argus]|nr:hypothetical protein Q8A73_007082 [Channa argus]